MQPGQASPGPGVQARPFLAQDPGFCPPCLQPGPTVPHPPPLSLSSSQQALIEHLLCTSLWRAPGLPNTLSQVQPLPQSLPTTAGARTGLLWLGWRLRPQGSRPGSQGQPQGRAGRQESASISALQRASVSSSARRGVSHLDLSAPSVHRSLSPQDVPTHLQPPRNKGLQREWPQPCPVQCGRGLGHPRSPGPGPPTPRLGFPGGPGWPAFSPQARVVPSLGSPPVPASVRKAGGPECLAERGDLSSPSRPRLPSPGSSGEGRAGDRQRLSLDMPREEQGPAWPLGRVRGATQAHAPQLRGPCACLGSALVVWNFLMTVA